LLVEEGISILIFACPRILPGSEDLQTACKLHGKCFNLLLTHVVSRPVAGSDFEYPNLVNQRGSLLSKGWAQGTYCSIV